MISPEKKSKIIKVVNVAEMGSEDVKYGDVYVYPDGPNGVRQLTLATGFTEYGGALKKVMEKYVAKKGVFSNFFKEFLGSPGPTLKTSPVLATTKGVLLIDYLKKAGKEKVMQEAQDEVRDESYWEPAKKFFIDNGFTLPLSMLVIYDSFIHSGSIPKFLRNRFSEKTPKNGGDEKEWIKAYLKTRHLWLQNHSRKILRNTIYRTSSYLESIAKNDWDLQKPVKMNGKTIS